jgi:hypothetical protein
VQERNQTRYQSRLLRSRGFRVLQSIPPRKPRRPMACLLPFRPWLSPDLRVFSFEAPRRFRILIVGRLLSCTSTPPQRLASCAPPTYPRLMPTMSHSRQTPRYVPSAPQRLRTQEPLFSPPYEGVPPALPCQREVPLLGFGYPFSGLKFPDPWKRFSAPNVHGLRPSELFSGLMIGNRFPGPLSAPALFHKTNRPCAGASAACSHHASRAPRRSPGV